jgi:hypothetical protein
MAGIGGKDAVTLKKQRMEQALGMLKSMGEMEYTKAVAILSFNIGLSESKSKEYIRMFKELGRISVEGGIIMPYVETEVKNKEEKKIDKMIK